MYVPALTADPTLLVATIWYSPSSAICTLLITQIVGTGPAGSGVHTVSPSCRTYHTNFVSGLKNPPALKVAVSPGYFDVTTGFLVINGSAFTVNVHGTLLTSEAPSAARTTAVYVPSSNSDAERMLTTSGSDNR